MNRRERIVILDFGSQYTRLIARRIREVGVYCEILPYHVDPARVFTPETRGIIFSGSPSSLTKPDAPRPAEAYFHGKLPVLGICYGCQVIGDREGVRIVPAERAEFGAATLRILRPSALFQGLSPGDTRTVWMSHRDILESLPENFQRLAETDDAPIAAMEDASRRLYGVQFHPEVTHSRYGRELLANFALGICNCAADWLPMQFVEDAVENIRKTTGGHRVVCALSGGVDSSVLAALLDRAVGDRLVAVFVNNGLLREGEPESVAAVFQRRLGKRFVSVDAEETFLQALEDIEAPEAKRKTIGEVFIRVFEKTARELGEFRFLAQGTLYPDVIESVSADGKTVIKTHHNVGGLPEKMHFELLEPLRNLFKDEVRQVGLALGLPETLVFRQPFPGPGLAVRIPGKITRERLRILRKADAIVREEIAAAGLMRELWQAFAVLLPIRTVGVMGDDRTYEFACAVRAVRSTDAMTADWARLPYEVLDTISRRISNEVRGINRVVYDISSKPPATIEWE